MTEKNPTIFFFRFRLKLENILQIIVATSAIIIVIQYSELIGQFLFTKLLKTKTTEEAIADEKDTGRVG